MRHGLLSLSSALLITVTLYSGFIRSAAADEVALPYATVKYSGTKAILHANSRRDLASMVYTLWQEFHIPLTFEDAPVMFAADFDDITVPDYRSRFPGDRLLVPRGGVLDIQFTVPAVGQPPPDTPSILDALLNAHSRAGYPGEYGLRREDEIWHIIPLRTRDQQGRPVQVTPLMDTPVRITREEGRTNAGVISTICELIYRSTGRRLFLGTHLSSSYLEGTADQDFNGTAREWLESTFVKSRGHALWILNCTPLNGPCALNIY